MNYNLQKSNTKGKEELSLTISPSDGLESDFFKRLFEDEKDLEIIKVPNNKDQIIIRKKEVE